jgi:hypothetical protein
MVHKSFLYTRVYGFYYNSRNVAADVPNFSCELKNQLVRNLARNI